MPYTFDNLYAPQSFLDAPIEEIWEVCNGCGAADSKFDFVTDTIYLLKITRACHIHDWMYHHGKCLTDKFEADITFLMNLVRLIKEKTSFPPLRMLRYIRAFLYFIASHDLMEGL